MNTLAFWKAVTADREGFLEELVSRLEQAGIRYCLIDSQAVNAYVDPLVSLDLDLVVAADQIEAVERLMADRYAVARFPHSLNISARDSKLRVQIQTDSRYYPFVERAARRDVLGLELPVAAVEDVLQGKVWAAEDPDRRPSKRRKDLLDIERLVESFPHLRAQVPAGIMKQLAG